MMLELNVNEIQKFTRSLITAQAKVKSVQRQVSVGDWRVGFPQDWREKGLEKERAVTRCRKDWCAALRNVGSIPWMVHSLLERSLVLLHTEQSSTSRTQLGQGNFQASFLVVPTKQLTFQKNHHQCIMFFIVNTFLLFH